MSCECITWKYRSTSSFEAGESSPTCWATLPALQTKHTTTVIKKCFIDILRKSICRVADIPVGFQLLFTGWELPAVVGGELEFKSGGRNNRLPYGLQPGHFRRPAVSRQNWRSRFPKSKIERTTTR